MRKSTLAADGAVADAGDSPTIVVGIATYNRPDIVAKTVSYILSKQTTLPSLVIISCSSVKDAGSADKFGNVKVVVGSLGSSVQRNKILEHLPRNTDIVVFFDDDFVPHKDWLATASKVFRDRPEIVALTGSVLIDDIKGPGLSNEQAISIIEEHKCIGTPQYTEPYSPYGCNMAFRVSAIRNFRFDERLVLYGWLEDRDFGARIAKSGGALVKFSGLWGIHLGVKRGRVPGRQFGYSQMINPIYLYLKGSMKLSSALMQMLRNGVNNIVLSVWPEKFIDRRGRLVGNILGLRDLMRGRVAPEAALSFAKNDHQ
ncbi:glycosyltransferase family 2 protein [Methylobacterium sp.]|uniref:glycosyltransferase family 2 protein n=1 Tax=Methylobacterium sp. TaxID=409 RepID=UPI003B00A87D